MPYQEALVGRNAVQTLRAPRRNNGFIRIYSGTKPTTPETALSGNTLLAELRYNATAFGAVVNAVLTAAAITGDTAADATGTATFFRDFASDGTTVEGQGDVATSGSDLNLSSTSIILNGPVNITSLTLAQP